MAATDNALQELHATVARALSAAIQPVEIPGKEGEPSVTLPPSAAHLAAAITFLKNNSITASPTTNAALSKLKDDLEARRKKKPAPQALAEAEELLAGRLMASGGTVQ